MPPTFRSGGGALLTVILLLSAFCTGAPAEDSEGPDHSLSNRQRLRQKRETRYDEQARERLRRWTELPERVRPPLIERAATNSTDAVVEVCDANNSPNHFIYCSGKLLEAVMDQHLFVDSKTFVDMPLKFPAVDVQKKFNEQFPMPASQIDKQKLKAFIDEHFLPEGTELLKCELSDWTKEPLMLKRIQDKTLREWAMSLNAIWKTLCRRMDPVVAKNPDRYSLLYVPKPFVVPGGRFREFYYWDSYWTIKGLLASGMHATVKHIIENFVYIVREYGFIPNGGRVYYLRRSQPPLLTAMVYEYFEATHDVDFIKEILPTLEEELAFWDRHRNYSLSMNGQTFDVYQYRTESNVPRPESFREDVDLVKQLTKEAEKQQIWQDLASAAESGWDFSSRWLNDSVNLRTIATTSVIPVDLNAYMCWNFDILSYLYWELDDDDRSNHYRDRYLNFRRAFQKVFYVKQESGWFDYNLKSGAHNFDFYPSIVTPLFTHCYHSINLRQSERIFKRMDDMGVFNYAGGIPTSLNKESHQQWDYPNGWSPLNHMVIEGLRRSESPSMQQKAFWIAEKWVLANYRVFKLTSAMWEKYNVIGTYPKTGSGGEYEVQAGFGWTNGAILDLLATYSDRMHFEGLDVDPDGVASEVIVNSEPPTTPATSLGGVLESALGLTANSSPAAGQRHSTLGGEQKPSISFAEDEPEGGGLTIEAAKEHAPPPTSTAAPRAPTATRHPTGPASTTEAPPVTFHSMALTDSGPLLQKAKEQEAKGPVGSGAPGANGVAAVWTMAVHLLCVWLAKRLVGGQ